MSTSTNAPFAHAGEVDCGIAIPSRRCGFCLHRFFLTTRLLLGHSRHCLRYSEEKREEISYQFHILLAEQQRGELGQIPAPDHPGMHAGRLDIGVLNAFRFQPFAQVSVHCDQAILSAAGNP